MTMILSESAEAIRQTPNYGGVGELLLFSTSNSTNGEIQELVKIPQGVASMQNDNESHMRRVQLARRAQTDDEIECFNSPAKETHKSKFVEKPHLFGNVDFRC